MGSHAYNPSYAMRLLQHGLVFMDYGLLRSWILHERQDCVRRGRCSVHG